MDGQRADLTDLVNRALERASQNLTIDKLLDQAGLDAAHRNFEAVINRLIELALVNINVANLCALVGAGFYAATLLMRTMVPLRVFGIISILFFMAYGALGGAIATFLMYLLALPLNSARLIQMLTLVRKARVAAQGDLSMDWLRPFMDKRSYKKGDVLFRKGQRLGELGFLTPDNKRTQTVECVEGGDMLTIQYERLLELYFQNPEFGYYFLRLTSNRLLQNNARLQNLVEQNRKEAGLPTAPTVAPVQPEPEATPRREAPA
jgi:hypothetical protein